MVRLFQGDCLELMKDIPDGSIDMILCDLPYGTTACKWDVVIPFDSLWVQYERVIKQNGAIVLTASQPFTSNLVMSNPKLFKHSWIWNKKKPGNFLNAKHQPLKSHEDILVFSKGRVIYHPIMTTREKIKKNSFSSQSGSTGILRHDGKERLYTESYPKTILEISNANQSNRIHPTQKPVALMEYLIKTYTNEGETILDNCMGSGTTGIACLNTKRHFIGMEKDSKYFEIAKKRISEASLQFRLA